MTAYNAPITRSSRIPGTLRMTPYPSLTSPRRFVLSLSSLEIAGISTAVRVATAKNAPNTSSIRMAFSGNTLYNTAAMAGLAIMDADSKLCEYPAYFVSWSFGMMDGMTA